MDGFMNPQRNKAQGLRPEEKSQPWSFVECKRVSIKSVLTNLLINKFYFA